MTVRLRYAPSPTGDPHPGNIRTALWSWLHARRHGGAFVLRLEDTDRSRSVEGSLARIEQSLRWLGLDWDEGPAEGGPYGPYVQSQRLDRYAEAVARLLAEGRAYRCFCPPAELHAMRERQRAAGGPPGYSGVCRGLDRAEADARAAAGEEHAVRFAMPREGSTSFADLIRGEISYENRVLDDFVVLKSDGFPTYHLAHVVDDHAMAITHVTRGDEWLPSTPRHVRLFEALGHEPPAYVHTPIILGPDGGKLSKRDGAKSVLEFAEEGYLPEALLNFLAITGWAPDGSTEVMSRGELIAAFDLADLNPAPAAFDADKLAWMNGVHMRRLPPADLADRFARRLDADLPPGVPRPLDRSLVEAFAPLVRERVKLLSEVAPMTDFFFAESVGVAAPPEFVARGLRRTPERAAPALRAAIGVLEPLAGEWRAEALEAALRGAADEAGLRAGDLFMLCRVAVTGKRVTPPLFETMEIAGAAPCLERLRAAEAALAAAYPPDGEAAPDGEAGS